MNPQQILEVIKNKGISIKALGDKIILTPKGAAGSSLLATVRAIKPQLIALLSVDLPPSPHYPQNPQITQTDVPANPINVLVPPQNPVEAAVAELDPLEREEWEERSAVKEIDAGLDKATAERKALVEVISGPPPADPVEGEKVMDNEPAKPDEDWSKAFDSEAPPEPDVHEMVQSESDPRVKYHVRRASGWWSCSCKSFQYRGACQHVVKARLKVEGHAYGV